MESEGSLTNTQVRATCHYPEPGWSIAYPIPLSEYLNIILLSTSGSLKWAPSLTPPHQDPVYTSPLLSPIHATCPAHSILLNFIIWKLLGKQYRSLSSLLCSFLHSPVTSSLPHPPIFPSARYSQTPSAHVPPSNVSDQVSCPYITAKTNIILYT